MKFRQLSCWAAAVTLAALPLAQSSAQMGNARRQSGGPAQWMKPPVSAPRLQYKSFPSKAAGTEVSYLIYTPEEYDTAGGKRFPVIYWLHGIGGGQQGIPGIIQGFDAAIRAGKMPPALVVFVNGLTDSMWCDSKDGKAPVETAFIKELIPHIDGNFRTLATREGRLIEGFSMGGFGAARLGFQYPDLFGTVSILAGALLDENSFQARHQGLFQDHFGGDIAYFNKLSPWTQAEKNEGVLKAKTKIRQVVGDRDPTLSSNRDYDAHLTKLGIPHAFTIVPGIGHAPGAIYSALGEDNWKFYAAVFCNPETH